MVLPNQPSVQKEKKDLQNENAHTSHGQVISASSVREEKRSKTSNNLFGKLSVRAYGYRKYNNMMEDKPFMSIIIVTVHSGKTKKRIQDVRRTSTMQ